MKAAACAGPSTDSSFISIDGIVIPVLPSWASTPSIFTCIAHPFWIELRTQA